jgi:hypothetical protein
MSTNAHVCSTCSCAFSILFLKAFNSLITPDRGPDQCSQCMYKGAPLFYILISMRDVMHKVIQNKRIYTFIIKKVSTPFVI